MRGHNRWVPLITLAVTGVLLCGGLYGRGFNEPPANGDRSAPRPADMVLLNGTVYTADRRHPWAQAVAVENGNIVFVGSTEKAKLYVGAQTRVIDLKQATLLPGIIDSHIHPAQGEFYIRRACNVVSLTVNEL
jgi:hypothetical protein